MYKQYELKYEVGQRVVVHGKPGKIGLVDLSHLPHLPYFIAYDSGNMLWVKEDEIELEPAVALKTEAQPDPFRPIGMDPKAALGATKPAMGLVPAAGIILAALAAEDGAKKYGGYNYREGHPVELMTYLHAAKRHLDAFIDREDFTSDTGVPNLGGVIMCCSIVADVMALGVGVDNRPPKGRASELQDAGKAWKLAVAAGENPLEAAHRLLAPAMGLKP